VTLGQGCCNGFLAIDRGQAVVRIDVGGGVFQARQIRQPGKIPAQRLKVMESKVVKNLTVDAKLVVHLVLPRAGTFRQRNFFIARKATNRLWVTLRSQEGSHEKSFSYPENYTFSKPNRTFHRRSGQLSTRRKERMAKYRRCGRRAHASSNNSPAKGQFQQLPRQRD